MPIDLLVINATPVMIRSFFAPVGQVPHGFAMSGTVSKLHHRVLTVPHRERPKSQALVHELVRFHQAVGFLERFNRGLVRLAESEKPPYGSEFKPSYRDELHRLNVGSNCVGLTRKFI